jgi:polar amino acid transport system substrate-binding protein
MVKNSLVASLLLLICLAGSGQTQTEKQPGVRLGDLRTGARSLIVGGVADFPPFNTTGPNGQQTGMDREILRAIARRVGIESVEFKTMPLSELPEALQSGKIDVIGSNYWITPERQRLFLFTIPYYIRGGVGASFPRSGNYSSAKDLAGKRIAVLKSSYEEQYARDYIPNANLIPIDGSAPDLYNTLTNGQADAVVSFYVRGKDVLAREQNEKFDSVLLQPMQAAFAVRKTDTQLRDMLNDGLRKLWEDGSLTQIKAAYLDPLGIEPARHP